MQPGGEVLERISISLNGEDYLLLPRALAQQLEPFSRPRQWKVDSKRQAQIREPRQYVRPGEIDGEIVGYFNDWSKGIGSADDQRPGVIYKSYQMNGFIPGTLRANPTETHIGITQASSIDPTSEITIPITFNAEEFIISGRYVTRITAGGAISVDKDFGSGVRVTDAIVWNSELVVGFGGSTNKIQVRNTAGTWTAATDAVYVDHFTIVQDRLWRVTATNAVSNIASAANPRTLAGWSAGITVGDVTTGATDLNALGERVLVSKPEGLFPGDASTIFPNQLPSLQIDSDNGKNTLVVGSAVFFPHARGCFLYREGRQVVEVGLWSTIRSFTTSNLADRHDGHRIRALAAQDEYLWAATEPAVYPAALVSRFEKTTDGSTYTDYTTNVTDNNSSTNGALGSLDTVANNDWVVVGYNARFDGLDLELGAVNTNAAVMTVEYWNGTAWVAMPMAQDLTVAPALASPSLRGTAMLSRSGRIIWDRPAGGAWAASTIDGLNAFWVRISTSAALSTTVSVVECRILTATGVMDIPYSASIFRGRPARGDDMVSGPIVWEPYGTALKTWLPTGLQVVDQRIYPFSRTGALVCAGQAQWTVFPFGRDATASAYFQVSPDVSNQIRTPFYDFGTPTVLKRLIRIQVKGTSFSGANSLEIGVLMDKSTSVSATFSFSTNGAATVDSNPTMNGLSSFYALQLQIRSMNTSSADLPLIVEGIELTIRELPRYKDETTMQLWIADGLYTAEGGTLPDAKVMLTNLGALVGSGVRTQINPVGTSETVTVYEVEEQGVGVSDRGTPWLAVGVRTAQE